MPTWMVVVTTAAVAAASFAASVKYLYDKLLKPTIEAMSPAAKLLADAAEHNELLRDMEALFGDDTLMPLLIDIKSSFASTAHWASVLNEIVGQVRNDSGSTVKDMVDSIQLAVETNAKAVADLSISVEVVKALIGHLHAQGALNIASGQRTEAAAILVRDNLHASEARADAVMDEATGAAADAAARSEPPAE